MIDQLTIQRIQDAAQIVEVVSDFVTLRKRGVNFVGLCPFHDDRTPSFYVSPAKNICKCFACGEGGTPVHFVMKHEQMSYPEALKFLARKYNIQVVEKELTNEERQAQDDRESMFILNEYARDYFVKTLLENPEGKAVGLSYFKERGFREDTIRKFQLGYGLDEWSAFSEEAQKNGYQREYLIKTGLSTGGEDGRPLTDRFRGRVMFPVHTISGKVVAFGGRILKKSDKLAKYVNSPESEVYSKSRELYGLFFAKGAIVKADKCFLVEGYTDVISMHQAGVENVVSSSGTALTHGQIRMIRRFSENITVLYDGDAAGIKAALRGIDLLLEQGMNVRVVLLPDGEDPDSFARKQNAEQFNRFIEENEQDFIRFKTELLLDEAGSDPIKRAGLITNIVESISLVPDTIKRSVYIKDTAILFDTREEVIIEAVRKVRIKNYERIKDRLKKDGNDNRVVVSQPAMQDASVSGKRRAVSKNPYEFYERELIRYIVRYASVPVYVEYKSEIRSINGKNQEVEVMYEDGPPVVDAIRMSLADDRFIFGGDTFFTNELYQRVYEEACKKIDEGSFDSDKYFVSHMDPEVSRLATDLISDKYQLSKIHAKAIGEKEDDKTSRLRERNSLDRRLVRAIGELKNAYVMQKIKEVRKAMAVAEHDRQIELMAELKQLQEFKIALAKSLGERIVLRF